MVKNLATWEDLNAAIEASRIDAACAERISQNANRIVNSVFASVREAADERRNLRSAAMREAMYARIDV